MSVSAEEQQRRSGSLIYGVLGILFATPALGDAVGLLTMVGPLCAKTLVKSSRRTADLTILAGLIFLFCPVAYVWFFLMPVKSLGWILVLVTRFLLIAKGLPWYFRRIGDDGFFGGR